MKTETEREAECLVAMGTIRRGRDHYGIHARRKQPLGQHTITLLLWRPAIELVIRACHRTSGWPGLIGFS